MRNRREFIQTLGLTSFGVGVDPSHAATVKKRSIGESIRAIITEEPRGAYLPGPTRLKPLPELSHEAPLLIDTGIPSDTISFHFTNARSFFRERYLGSSFEKRRYEIEKQFPGYQIIPYVIIQKDGIIEAGTEAHPTIIHLARKKNPRPTGADDYLLEWMGPIESGFLVDIMGVAGKAETYEGLSRVKTLGAGTNFDIHDEIGRQYIVLATAYPQYASKDPNIQTPFSEGLSTPKVLAQGRQYFELLQGTTTRILANAPWALILRDLEWYKIIQGLILTENMSIAPNGANEAETKQFYDRELRKVFALLGANLSEAFQRKSGAGAKGLVQFTESTWEGKIDKQGKKTGIRYQYPIPGLQENPDFTTLIRNHELSVIAACAHVARQYEDYLKHPKVGDSFRALETPYKHIVLAAGYNSNNSHRITDFSHASNRGSGGLTGVVERFYRILTNSGAEETRGYMRKFVFALRSLGYHVPEVSFSRLSAYNLPK